MAQERFGRFQGAPHVKYSRYLCNLHTTADESRDSGILMRWTATDFSQQCV